MPVSRDVLRAAISNDDLVTELGPEFDSLGTRYSGKVRDNFSRDGRRTIIVSDRVSAFDRVLGTIPFKGQVLNGLAAYWFGQTKHLVANHVLEVPDAQAMETIECTPIPVEMVVRGYLTGVSSTSIWTAYAGGARTFCGHSLADGMRKHQRLPKNLVTPSTKAKKGDHDHNVSRAELLEQGVVPAELYDKLEATALAVFGFGQQLALSRGLLLVDTKYEFGLRPDGELVLIDEMHTPDSSRYWFADSYEKAMTAGEDPRSLDKEFLRRWLVSEGFRGEGPPPALPDELRIEAATRYIETYELVTGKPFVADTEPPIARLRRVFKVA
ncbi:MAG: phosphoribosylaminoimidazolesuccinocarboxamide synthase [Nannocystaceae bacterium]